MSETSPRVVQSINHPIVIPGRARRDLPGIQHGGWFAHLVWIRVYTGMTVSTDVF